MSRINIEDLQVATEINDNDFKLMEKPEGTRKVLGSVFINRVKGDKGDTPSIAHLETKINNLVASCNGAETLRVQAENKRVAAETNRQAHFDKWKDIIETSIESYDNVTTITNSEIDTIIANALK